MRFLRTIVVFHTTELDAVVHGMFLISNEERFVRREKDILSILDH